MLLLLPEVSNVSISDGLLSQGVGHHLKLDSDFWDFGWSVILELLIYRCKIKYLVLIVRSCCLSPSFF